jgi:hypothetical protein
VTGLTLAGDRLLSRLRDLIADDSDWRKAWTVRGVTAEWTRMKTVTHAVTYFPAGTEYIQFVQVSIQSGKPYIRICRAPWVEIHGRFVSFKAANLVLDDPAAALESK